MAVSITATDYSGVGTGASATYGTGIYANASDQIKVYVAGVLKTLGADYTLNNLGGSAGVDVVGTFTNGAAVYIERVTPITQLVDTQNNETILEDVLDAEFDKLTMIAQELNGKASRALLVPKGETGGTLPASASRVGKFLTWDSFGNPIVSSGTGTDAGLRTDLAASSGSGLLGWLRAATGAVTKFVSTKLGFRLDAEDFFPNNWVPATDDVTTYLQAAINEAAASGRTLYLPAAFKCGALTVPANTHLLGVGKKSNITAIAGTYNMFTVTGSHVKIENMWIEDLAKSGGWDIIIACGTNTLKFLTFSNIVAQNSYGLVTDSGTGTNQAGSHIVVLFHDVLCGAHRGPGFKMTRGYAYQFFERCSVDYVGISASNFTAYDFNPTGMGGAAGGYTFVDCTVTGTCGTYNNAAQHGWSIQNAAAVWMERCSADTVAGTGMILNNINGIKSTDCWVSLCGGDGMTLTTVFNSNFTSFNAWGRNYLTPNGSGTDGVRVISGCFSVNFTGGTISSWGRHGFNKSAVQAGGIRLTGMLLLSNGLAGVGYGVNDIGNSALHLIGCGFGSNQQGNGNLQGTFSYYSVCQLNSGAVTSGGAGPLTF